MYMFSYTCIYDQNFVDLSYIVFVCLYLSIVLYFLFTSTGQSRCPHKGPAVVSPAAPLAFHFDCAKALYKQKLT